MKNLIVIFSLFLGTVVQGQNDLYYPLPESNAIWNFHYYAWCGGPNNADEQYSITIAGDTSINNQTYKKLWIPSILSHTVGICPGVEPGYKGAFRQDTTAKKVYYMPPLENIEQLLFDFNLAVGDTVTGYTQLTAQHPDVVLSIDSVLIGNTFRHRWNINNEYDISIIEGVGSTYGLVEQSPGGYIITEEGFEFNCFSHFGVTLYPDTLDICDSISIIKPLKIIPDIIKILPNPSSGNFTVNLSRNDWVMLNIYDLTGKIIRTRNIKGVTGIQIEGIENGMYIVEVCDKNRNKTREKISCL
jgi:hypothetical protein